MPNDLLLLLRFCLFRSINLRNLINERKSKLLFAHNSLMSPNIVIYLLHASLSSSFKYSYNPICMMFEETKKIKNFIANFHAH